MSWERLNSLGILTLLGIWYLREPTGDFFDREEVLSNLEQSIYSITGHIDTAFRFDTESDQSIIEENLWIPDTTPNQTIIQGNSRIPGNTPEATPAVIVNMTKEEELNKLSEDYIRASNDTEREVVQKKVSEGDILQKTLIWIRMLKIKNFNLQWESGR